jgi:hypothetical protein
VIRPPAPACSCSRFQISNPRRRCGRAVPEPRRLPAASRGTAAGGQALRLTAGRGLAADKERAAGGVVRRPRARRPTRRAAAPNRPGPSPKAPPQEDRTSGQRVRVHSCAGAGRRAACRQLAAPAAERHRVCFVLLI